MLIRILCACGETLGADTALAASTITCPRCQRRVRVPVPSGASVVEVPPAAAAGVPWGSAWIAPVSGSVAAVLAVGLVTFWAATGPDGSASPTGASQARPSVLASGSSPDPAVGLPLPAAPSPLVEKAARDALEAIRKYEGAPTVPNADVVSLYEKNLIALYPNTKAADEARQRIALLRGPALPGPSLFPSIGPKPTASTATGTGSLTPERVFAMASPAVVFVETKNTLGLPRGSGSAFFVSRGGLLVTNYHVVNGADSISVTLTTGVKRPVVRVVATDKVNDLALLKTNGPEVTCLEVGQGDLLKVGARVYAIGSPQGLPNTFSDGIVSALGRDGGGLKGLIQTTVPISRGSSGGPLLSAEGKLVGVTTGSIESGQNLNFAVPATCVQTLLDKAAAGGAGE
jgi:hypothetical protein